MWLTQRINCILAIGARSGDPPFLFRETKAAGHKVNSRADLPLRLQPFAPGGEAFKVGGPRRYGSRDAAQKSRIRFEEGRASLRAERQPLTRSTVRYLNVFSIACLPLALSLAACSAKEDPPPAGCSNFNYTGYTASSAPTLEADVMPIFTPTCAVAIACHGGGAHPPNLGGMQNGMPVSSATVKAGLLNITSTEVLSMKYVVPGAPEDSYLMRKSRARILAAGSTACRPEPLAAARPACRRQSTIRSPRPR